MTRVFGIELRRSAAAGTALTVLLIGVVLLFFAGEDAFTTGWMQLAMTQRFYLAVLWPLALAAGAWQGRREHRANVGELFRSTPRPRAQRSVPTLGAMAIAVVVGYLAMGVAGGVWIAGTARYFPGAVLVVTAVGLLALVAAVWLGLAAGRTLPWMATAPALAIAGLALLLLIPGATRPRGWLALVFSPIYEMNLLDTDAYATVPGQASVSQAIWLGGLTIAAVLLVSANSWRLRTAALLPLVVGASLAVAVMPRDSRYVTDAVDPVARALVCADDQKVCVSRVHSGLLDEVFDGAVTGLTTLRKLPGAPTRVHEDTTSYFPETNPVWSDDVALLPIVAGKTGHLLDKSAVPVSVVTAAFRSPAKCYDVKDTPKVALGSEQLAAAFWLIGRQPDNPGPFRYDDSVVPEAVTIWKHLKAMPDAEAQARLVALRTAALSCSVTDGQLSK